jgi:hypothetical protein
MLVCDKCGTLVEAHELPFVTEAHGERHRNYNCNCGGEFVEATKCDVCGEWFDNRELDGVCEVCLAEYETTGDALAIGGENTTSVEINGFIAYALDPVVINEILTKWVEENITDHSRVVVDYCEDDKPWFADYVKEKVKGNREKSL